MPPKIAALVKFFEEQQQQEQDQERERSSPSSSRSSPTVAASNRRTSQNYSYPSQQRRRVTAPLPVTGTAGTTLAETIETSHVQNSSNSPPRASTRGGGQRRIVASLNNIEHAVKASDSDLSPTPSPVRPPPAALRAIQARTKASPAIAKESKANATNVTGAAAGLAIAQRINEISQNSSTPTQKIAQPSLGLGTNATIARREDKHLNTVSPATVASDQAPSLPVPVRDRFRPKPSNTDNVSHDTESPAEPNTAGITAETTRDPGLPPPYTGSISSLRTLVQHPTSDSLQTNSRTDDLLLHKNSEDCCEDDKLASDFIGNRKGKDKQITEEILEGVIRPPLPSSQSNGKLSTLTTDVPAYSVFAPNAKALDLPLLDEYIDHLPVVQFSDTEKIMSDSELKAWKKWIDEGADSEASSPLRASKPWRTVKNFFKNRRKGYIQTSADDEGDGTEMRVTPKHVDDKLKPLNAEQIKRSLIFPPMHRLPPSLTVTDLKYNRSKKAPLISLNVLLSTGIDAVLGAEGSTYAVSLVRVEAFRDLIQIIGSVTNFAKPGGVTSTAAAAAAVAATTSVASNKTIAGSIGTLINTTTAIDKTSPGYVLLTVVPSVLGLDFVSAFGKAILWLWVFTIICFIGCWEFHVMAKEVSGSGSRSSIGHAQYEHVGEGLDCEDPLLLAGKSTGYPGFKWYSRLRRSRGFRITIIFLVTSLYLPLSKISIGALAWTSDYWTVDNYYLTEDDPHPIRLGSVDQYRDPLDFCWTTTMHKKGWNWAPPIMIVASVTVIVVTLWFPISLLLVVQKQVPRIDKYTELGEKRRDLQAEYTRLLERDRSPFSFIYNEYRKPWAGFKSAYMALKLINVLCITLLTKDNCIFRGRHRVYLDVIRQSTILGFMICWMVLQIWAKPFNDRYSNNSDWCSRIAYVVIAILGLAAALKLPGKAAYGGWLLITFTAVSYLFNGYFAVIGTVFAQRIVQKWQKRLDFSIDIFNPTLDTAKHVTRRIQQETISTLLLAEPEYKVRRRPNEPLVFCNLIETNEAKEEPAQTEFPPYLLDFRGSQGERHLENLKILRELGLARYVMAVERSRESHVRFRQLQETIVDLYTGPDCVWWPERGFSSHFREQSYFGRATVLPFPFTIVFRYDDDASVVSLTSEHELEAYVTQNESQEAKAGRSMRLALRALEGSRCYYPYTTEQAAGSSSKFSFRRAHPSVGAEVRFNYGVLNIARNLDYSWRGYNYSSGFKVTLEYHDGRYLQADGRYRGGIDMVLDGEELGISSNFAMTNTLARFMQLNRRIIEQNMPLLEDKIDIHRNFFAEEVRAKRRALSYSFLLDVYGNEHLDRSVLADALYGEEDANTRDMLIRHEGSMTLMAERMQAANSSILCQWWYLFWDDLYRRNCSSVAQLPQFELDFSPKYRSSICFKPMSRKSLETFLSKRQLWESEGTKGFFTRGFLNRIYFYLDEMLFDGTKGGIAVKAGTHRHAVLFHELGSLRAHDAEDSFGQESRHTYDTGQGTDHDESFVRNRPAFQFEEMYERTSAGYRNDSKAPMARLWDRILLRTQLWFGLRPYEVASDPPSLYFSLRQVGETYKVSRSSPRTQ